MNSVVLPNLPLRLRLLAQRAGWVMCAGLALLAIGSATLAWLLPRQGATGPSSAPTAPAGPRPPIAAAPAANDDQNLKVFYDTLGERRYVEQQVKTLFALAAKNGLELSQGEYKAGFDAQAAVQTYRVDLPLKGAYGALWQFCVATMIAIPFASLDEISFRRAAIGDDMVEAKLRFTFYLNQARQ